MINEQNNINRPQKTNKILIILIVVGCVLTLVFGGLGAYFLSDKLGLNFGKKNVELKYTDVSSNTSTGDGVYMTDVSGCC